MFERFSDRARHVVLLAQDEARALKHNYIGTEHILLGLFREEGLAARVLTSLGLPVEEVRAQVALIVGQGDEVPAGQIPFSPRAKTVLDLAQGEAVSLGHNYVGPEHILLGIVREGEGLAARILLDLDADAEKVRTEVMRMLAGPPRSESHARTPRLRLAVMDAHILAVERRDEVMQAAAEARDRDEARKSVARLLGITEQQASAVLEMRLNRFNQSDVADLRSEHKSVSTRLNQADG